MPKQTQNFLLKVSLVGSMPKIWRELIVPSNATFFALHVWLQDAMGWTDSHLHQFHTTNPYGRGNRGLIISYPYPEMEEDEEMIDERKEKLSTWFTEPKKKVWYEYDFGDGWIHEIVLKKILPVEKGARVPRVVAGARACPPEDCGGIGGYGHLLTAIADPKHPDHQDLTEWLEAIGAAPHDPEEFNPDMIPLLDPKERLREFEEGFGT